MLLSLEIFFLENAFANHTNFLFLYFIHLDLEKLCFAIFFFSFLRKENFWEIWVAQKSEELLHKKRFFN